MFGFHKVSFFLFYFHIRIVNRFVTQCGTIEIILAILAKQYS